MDQTESPPKVKGQEQEYREWKHHPMTALYRRYLQDFRQALIREALGRWEAGTLHLSHEQEMRGRMLALSEASSVEYEDIAKFYEEAEESNAAENPENGS